MEEEEKLTEWEPVESIRKRKKIKQTLDFCPYCGRHVQNCICPNWEVVYKGTKELPNKN